jgi:hypothetical protein
MAVLAATMILALAGAACQADAESDDPGTTGTAPTGADGETATGPTGEVTRVEVTIDNGSVLSSLDSVPAGTVIFEVTTLHGGGDGHAFGVWRTDIPPDELPLTTLGEALDPTAEGIEVVGFLSRARGTRELEVALTPSNYVLVCSVHEGEVAPFEVT